MSWFKIDDSIHSHPKFLQAGLEAMGLWLACGAYASQFLTDGGVPKAIAERFCGSAKLLRRLSNSLVEANLWSCNGDSWVMNDYLEYNPSKAEVVEYRKKKSEAGSVGGKARAQARASRLLEAFPSTRPDPDPDPEKQKQNGPSADVPPPRASGKKPASKGTRIDPTWEPGGDLVAWCESERIHPDEVLRCVPEFRDYWSGVAGAKGVKLDWSATFRNHIRKQVEWGKITPGYVPPLNDENHIDGLPIIRMKNREEFMKNNGLPDMTGLFGSEDS